MVRRDKQNYYLDMAQVALERSTCLRRSFGAVIVKNDVIISTGYNGAPRGRANCIDLNYCIRQQRNVPRGTQYELCRAIHAEANAIIAGIAGRNDWLDPVSCWTRYADRRNHARCGFLPDVQAADYQCRHQPSCHPARQ